jgi:AAA15 family ATPase/GTPase
MLTSFTVKNYRLFKELTIEPLSRLNLIAGKNNVGKTTLLEALWLYGGSTNPNLSIGVNALRGIRVFPLTPAGIWDNLFRNFNTDIEIFMTAMRGHEKQHKLRILLEDVNMVRIPVTSESQGNGLEQQESPSPRIKFYTTLSNGEVITQDAKIEHGNLVFESPKQIMVNAIFLAARSGINPTELATRLSVIEQRLEENYILNGLQVIEPRIQDVRISSFGESYVLQCKVNIPGLENRRVPLNYMGSGLFRYCEMLLAIVENRDGIVLIDEIENGIHHSVMEKVWEAIYSLADKFNVQVFATTHNIECIRAAYSAFKDKPEGVFALHRLDDIEGNIEAVTYSEEALTGAIEYEIEVR